MISGDPSVLEGGSDTGKRIEEYRSVLGEIEILLCRGSIWSFISGFFSCYKILSRKKFDIISSQDMEHSFLAWIFSKIYGIPWQMQIHSDIFNPHFAEHSRLNKIRVLLAKFLIPRASCIRVVSERIADSLIYNFKFTISKLSVLPIFVDVEQIRQAPVKIDLHGKYGRRKFIILMASRITREKNIELSIESFKAVREQVLQDLAQCGRHEQSNSPAGEYASHVKFVTETPLLLIVGDGPEKESLKNMVSESELSNFIKFEPHTNDLLSYYKTCDLFLLTSNHESYGRTLVEAAAAGCKIISSDVGVAKEILEPENIFPVGDKNMLAEKIKLALEGKIKPPKPIKSVSKEEYLKLYKQSFEKCLK